MFEQYMDEQNRIVLPLKTQAFGWTQSTPLKVTALMNEGIIIISAKRPFCKQCGETKNFLAKSEGGHVCTICLRKEREELLDLTKW